MFFSETDLSDFIEENDVKFIRMTFCDTFGNMQITDNKENKFFCFPIISMACTGSGY